MGTVTTTAEASPQAIDVLRDGLQAKAMGRNAPQQPAPAWSRSTRWRASQ